MSPRRKSSWSLCLEAATRGSCDSQGGASAPQVKALPAVVDKRTIMGEPCPGLREFLEHEVTTVGSLHLQSAALVMWGFRLRPRLPLSFLVFNYSHSVSI